MNKLIAILTETLSMHKREGLGKKYSSIKNSLEEAITLANELKVLPLPTTAALPHAIIPPFTPTPRQVIPPTQAQAPWGGGSAPMPSSPPPATPGASTGIPGSAPPGSVTPQPASSGSVTPVAPGSPNDPYFVPLVNNSKYYTPDPNKTTIPDNGIKYIEYKNGIGKTFLKTNKNGERTQTTVITETQIKAWMKKYPEYPWKEITSEEAAALREADALAPTHL